MLGFDQPINQLYHALDRWPRVFSRSVWIAAPSLACVQPGGKILARQGGAEPARASREAALHNLKAGGFGDESVIKLGDNVGFDAWQVWYPNTMYLHCAWPHCQWVVPTQVAERALPSQAVQPYLVLWPRAPGGTGDLPRGRSGLGGLWVGAACGGEVGFQGWEVWFELNRIRIES